MDREKFETTIESLLTQEIRNKNDLDLQISRCRYLQEQIKNDSKLESYEKLSGATVTLLNHCMEVEGFDVANALINYLARKLREVVFTDGLEFNETGDREDDGE